MIVRPPQSRKFNTEQAAFLFTLIRRALLGMTLIISGTAGAAPPVMLDGAIETMKAGTYLWAPQIAPTGPVMVIVNLKTQRAYVYRNGVPIGVTTVSTGTAGRKTPTGVFTILQKRVVHRSNRYSNAPMPFMQRLTWYGIAMHAGNLPGYPASHGCIRLPLAFAKLLYGITNLGLTVVITNDALVPEVSPQPPLTRRDDLDEQRDDTAFTWHPERSPTGPVSIVVSGRDRRLIVLRNGVLIGSSPIEIDEPVVTTVAFVLQSVDAKGQHWLRLVLPGQPAVAAGELTDIDRAKGRLPKEFQRLLTSILLPGATILVTRDTLRSGGTGSALTVITGAN